MSARRERAQHLEEEELLEEQQLRAVVGVRVALTCRTVDAVAE